MRSDIIHVHADGDGIKEALAQAEAVAAYKKLPPENEQALRELTEEMMDLLQGLTGEVEADFYIEDENGEYRLHLDSYTEMDPEKRARLIEATTAGKDAAAVGVLGKLRSLLERSFASPDKELPPFYTLGLAGGSMDPGASSSTAWSLARYKDAVREDEANMEALAELEHAALTRNADEVKIGIKGRNVEMTVVKKF